MTAIQTKIKTGAENVRWDMDALYQGLDDPRLDADVRRWTEAAKAFYADHKGKLAATLPQAIRDYAELAVLGTKPGIYLSFRLSLDTGDAAAKAKMAELENASSLIAAEYLEFFEHELVVIDQSAIDAHAAGDKFTAKHLPWLDLIRVFKPHLLPEQIEAALTKRSPFGPGSWSEFFDEFEADLRFDWRGEEKILNELLHLLSVEKDAEIRAEALKTINDGFAGHFAKYSAQTLYMVAGSKAIEGRERGYAHPMESRNKSSRLPDAVVDALHKAVTEHAGPLARRFYKLKAAILGLKTLRWSDRNAPMPFADTSVIPWETAVATVLAAYRSFSPTLADLIEKSVELKRIDAPSVAGKHGGAYNSSFILPGNVPAAYTLLNYMGSTRDVMTLAHELGHGVHGLLAGEAQGPLLQHAPIALCETASVFGEKTTFNHLKEEMAKTGRDEPMMALLMGKLDDMINTVVRQVGFSNLEKRLHGWDPASGQWASPKKLSVEQLDALWLETAHELYGKPGEVFTYENADHLWSYIGHFHRPFYVYGYAFGELLTQSLYAARPKLGGRFEPLYLEMLRAGGSKDAVELLKPFGLDPTDPRFWEAGIAVSLGAMLDETEDLARKMGIF